MATPVLQKINAFSANEGTTILFNMVGITQTIKSNKVVIYNSDDINVYNHIQNTTEYKNELPSNEDLVNGNSYSAEIEVYTGLNGSGTLVGKSQRVQFWCLDYPIVEFINPSEAETGIESTSYNFQVSVECNIDGSNVLNRVQYCQFELYKKENNIYSLVGSSDIIYGKGQYAGVGTEGDLYVLEYEFNDIDNGTYRASVNITTEQGMVIYKNSSDITIELKDIATPLIELYNNCEDASIDIDYIITNIEGESNVTEYDGSISLLEDGLYLIWGRKTNEDGNLSSQLEFPVVSTGYENTSNWSLFMKADTLIPSNSNPFIQNDYTYICKLSDILNSNGIYLYTRKVDEDNIKLVLYATSNNDDNNVSMVESNTISISKEVDEYYYILVNAYNGWYNLSIKIK